MEIDYKEIASYAIILIIVLIAAQHLNVVVSGSMEPAFYRGDIFSGTVGGASGIRLRVSFQILFA